MAGLGRRTFQAGEVLTASNVMAYLQDQAVMNFAGTAARGSAIGTAVAEGMVSYLADNNFVQAYDGTGWRSIGGVQVASGTATRDALLPSPIQGDKVFRDDLGYEQTYYGAYNSSTNPGGRASAGWYNNQRNMGIVPIVPPTVNVSGGTAAANSLGIVTFTAASSVSLNNVFTTAYDTYDVIIDITATTANGYPALRGRLAGTDNTTSNYYSMYHFSRATGVGVDGVVNSTNWFFGNNLTSSPYYMAKVTLQRLTSSTQKQGVFSSLAVDASSTFSFAGGLLFNAAAAFDGVTLYNNGGGNMTGTIRVLGYNS